MAVDDEKTIELRGGPLDGQRAKIPARNTRVSLPVNTADKYGAWPLTFRPKSVRPKVLKSGTSTSSRSLATLGSRICDAWRVGALGSPQTFGGVSEVL